jgi:hypothetical protein
MFYQLGANLRAADGSPVTHSIHGTIHALAAP